MDTKTDLSEVRVHDCLYGFCKERNDECKRCDAVVAILRNEQQTQARNVGDRTEASQGKTPS